MFALYVNMYDEVLCINRTLIESYMGGMGCKKGLSNLRASGGGSVIIGKKNLSVSLTFTPKKIIIYIFIYI